MKLAPHELGKLTGAIAAYIWAAVALTAAGFLYLRYGWPALALGALLAALFKAGKPP